jgi:hypothetical protein
MCFVIILKWILYRWYVNCGRDLSDSGKGPVADYGEKGYGPPGSTMNFNILFF